MCLGKLPWGTDVEKEEVEGVVGGCGMREGIG